MTKQLVTDRIRERFAYLSEIDRVDRVEVTRRTRDGRAVRLKVTDAAGKSFTLRAEDFRLTVGGNTLKSTRCRIATEPDAFVFSEGRGYGHGMGMCQYGAEGMARHGASAWQILHHYYPQSSLAKAYE
jgi:stage II sporulation protein D